MKATTTTKPGNEPVSVNACISKDIHENLLKATPVGAFDAMYLSGLYGSCLGSRNGFSGRGNVGPTLAKAGTVRESKQSKFKTSEGAEERRMRPLCAIDN